jgi:hypothetical protein
MESAMFYCHIGDGWALSLLDLSISKGDDIAWRYDRESIRSLPTQEGEKVLYRALIQEGGSWDRVISLLPTHSRKYVTVSVKGRVSSLLRW